MARTNGRANGNGRRGQAVQQPQQQAAPRGRQAPPPPPQPAAVGDNVPPALRAKGLGGPESQRLTYSGPSEGGGVQSRGQRDAAESQDGATRRERREQARQKAKADRKRR